MHTVDRASSWIETEYCASVAAALQARAEYFELLEDAMTSPARLVRAFGAWRKPSPRPKCWVGWWEPLKS